MSLNKKVKSWALYDFANSSYVLVFQSFLLPVFFATVLSSQGITLGSWGLVNASSTFLGVLLAFIAGGYADKNIRIKVLKNLIFMSFVGMVSLSYSVESYLEAVPYLFVITNAFFIATISLSDSILPFLSNNEDSTFENSGFAWGLGYVGGVISLIIVIGLQKYFGEYSGLAFISVALFYIVFSMLALAGLRGVNLNIENSTSSREIISINKKEKIILLIGFWLISECITVIILFYSIFASTEMSLSSMEIGVTLLIVQLIAFPATYYGGKLPSRYSYLLVLGISIFIWFSVIALLISSSGLLGLSLIVLLTGFVIGNSQSYLRSIYSLITNKSNSGKEFGFFALVSQAAIIVGPLIYGYVSEYLGSQKVPLLVLGVLMVIGFFLVYSVLSKNKNLTMQIHSDC